MIRAPWFDASNGILPTVHISYLHKVLQFFIAKRSSAVAEAGDAQQDTDGPYVALLVVGLPFAKLWRQVVTEWLLLVVE